MPKILHFFSKPITLNKTIQPPASASVELPPKRWFDFHLWTLVLVLLVGYPTYSIWRMSLYFNDLWSVIDIVLVVWGALAGLQLLNRRPNALRNTKLFFALYLLTAITAYVWFHVLGDGWKFWDEIVGALLRIGLIWLLIIFSQRARILFPDDPLPKRNPWLFLRRYFAGNLIGQVFTYGTIVLLVAAIVTTPAWSPTPSDGNSKKDTTQELIADAWLESNPDTLKQLVGQQTGIRPSIKVAPPVTIPLDAKTIYEQAAPAVVVIYTNSGKGTGFFLTADGVIATSLHILEGANDAAVMMKSGKLFPIRSILACKKNQDFCLMKIEAKDTSFLTLSDSSAVTVGDPIVVIGHPFGYNFSLSTGIISEIHEYEKVGTVFQFTAPTSPGNSGGPVLNTGGQVVGIVESGLDSNDAQNLNFAHSMASVRSFFEFAAKGKVE